MAGELTPDDVENRLSDRDDVDVIDIRSPETFAAGHIPDAENLPPSKLEAEAETRDWADEVIVACYVGKSSVQAARLIDHYADDDVDVASMAGGYDAWEGDLTESADADADADADSNSNPNADADANAPF